MEAICKNCRIPLQPAYKYCPQCSQKTALPRLSMGDVLHDAIHYFTHADKGFFQLIRDLIVKNGQVARDFTEGRRKKYFPPLNFYLVVAAIFVFIVSFTAPVELPNVYEQHPELTSMSNLAKKDQLAARYERLNKAIHFMNKYSNLMAMISLPLTAFIFWLFYKKASYNYTEHLVACMYMGGFVILMYALMIIPGSRMLGITGFYPVLVFFMFQMVYNTMFYYRFLKKRTIPQLFKAFGTAVVAAASWAVISGSTVQFYISHGFWGLLK